MATLLAVLGATRSGASPGDLLQTIPNPEGLSDNDKVGSSVAEMGGT